MTLKKKLLNMHTLNRLLRQNWALLKLKISVLQKKSEKYLQNSLSDKRHACKLYEELLKLNKNMMVGWRDRSVVKRLYFQKTGSQLPAPTGWFTTISNSSSKVSDALLTLKAQVTTMVHTHICTHTSTHACTQAKHSKFSDLSMLEQEES